MNPFRKSSEMYRLWGSICQIEGQFTVKTIFEQMQREDAYKAIQVMPVFKKKGLLKVVTSIPHPTIRNKTLFVYEVVK